MLTYVGCLQPLPYQALGVFLSCSPFLGSFVPGQPASRFWVWCSNQFVRPDVVWTWVLINGLVGGNNLTVIMSFRKSRERVSFPERRGRELGWTIPQLTPYSGLVCCIWGAGTEPRASALRGCATIRPKWHACVYRGPLSHQMASPFNPTCILPSVRTTTHTTVNTQRFINVIWAFLVPWYNSNIQNVNIYWLDTSIHMSYFIFNIKC